MPPASARGPAGLDQHHRGTKQAESRVGLGDSAAGSCAALLPTDPEVEVLRHGPAEPAGGAATLVAAPKS